MHPAVAAPAIAEEKGCSARDWAGDRLTLLFLWGLPASAMLAAALVEPRLRAVIWAGMLLWMGGACIANARRCGRTHCRYTGPFFLVMAGLVVVHAMDIVPLGPHAWTILGAVTIIGNALIWWASERLFGTFRQG